MLVKHDGYGLAEVVLCHTCIIALVLLMIFMMAIYGFIPGLVANIGLVCNLFTDDKRSGKTLDRTCSVKQQDNSGDDRGKVRVENRGESVAVTVPRTWPTCSNRVRWPPRST